MRHGVWLSIGLIGCNPYSRWPTLDSGHTGGTESSQAPKLDISPLSIRFGEVSIGTTHSDSVVLTSTGDEATIVRDLELFGHADFRIHNPPNGPIVLEPGHAEAIRIDYSPQTEGGHEARLHIDSDGLSGSFTLVITGTGTVD